MGWLFVVPPTTHRISFSLCKIGKYAMYVCREYEGVMEALQLDPMCRDNLLESRVGYSVQYLYSTCV